MEHPISRNHPNRWHTRVTVEVIRSSGGSNYRSYREFRDAQLAYMWIQDYITRPQIEHVLMTFEEMCTELDTEYDRMGLRGFVPVAQNDEVQLIIFYGVVRLV